MKFCLPSSDIYACFKQVDDTMVTNILLSAVLAMYNLNIRHMFKNIKIIAPKPELIKRLTVIGNILIKKRVNGITDKDLGFFMSALLPLMPIPILKKALPIACENDRPVTDDVVKQFNEFVERTEDLAKQLGLNHTADGEDYFIDINENWARYLMGIAISYELI